MSVIPRFRFALKPAEINEMLESLDKLGAGHTDEIARFENKFARRIKKKHGVFLSSARYGLYQTLKHLGFKEGDGIILPAWTHYSVPAMVVAAGLKPLFTDIEPGSYNMGPKTIPDDYWKNARAVIITHLYGCPADVKEISRIAKENNVVVIEDCAQGLGASIDGEPTGSFGYASYFSLSITKNLTTLKGGMLCTDDDELAEHLRNTRSENLAPTDPLKKVLKTCKLANILLNPIFFSGFVFPGLVLSTFIGIDPIHEKFREKIFIEKPEDKIPLPHPVQAILGQKQLDLLENHNGERHKNGKYLLNKLEGKTGAGLPLMNDKDYHIFMSFVIAAEDPWKVKKALLLKGIDSSPGYLENCAKMEIFREYGVTCPNAEKMAKKQLHIPVYPGLTKDDLERIAGGIIDSCPAKGS